MGIDGTRELGPEGCSVKAELVPSLWDGLENPERRSVVSVLQELSW